MAAVMDLATRNEGAAQENYAVGFTTSQGFELTLRAAKMLSNSELVPLSYRAWKEEKDAAGNFVKWVPNNSGTPSCAIALNMANRMNADVLMIMQNLYVVHGRPGWSSKFLIATFNQCGRFSAIKYEWATEEKKSAAFGCRAWATEKESGDRIEGPWITWELVRAEQWDTKRGSKWKTMPDLMFMYRAAAWMINTHAPEVSMGLPTAEENEDRIIDVTASNVTRPASLKELVRAAETINQETGEITTQAETATQKAETSTQKAETATPLSEPPAVSVATLIKRLNACKDADEAGNVMTDPDVDTLNAEDAGKLMAAYRAKFGGA